MDRFATFGTSSSVFQPSLTKQTGPPKQTLDKDDFLKLFLVQLRNQDPEKAQDQSQMMAQMAQFSTLEQITNLNKTLAGSAQTGSLTSASTLIGKTVEVGDGNGEVVTGQVGSVRLEGGEPKLMIGSQGYKLTNVVSVR